MSTQQFLIDASTRHQVFLQRYAGAESKNAVARLNELRRDINALLSQEPSDFQRSRLNTVLDGVNELMTFMMLALSADVKSSTHSLAISEAAFSAALYNKASTTEFTIPTEAALLSALELSAMSAPSGTATLTIDNALQQFGIKKGAEISQIISDGVTLGQTTAVISNNVSQIMSTLHVRQIDALVRTITNHTASVARDLLYRENADILDGYQWVATLDGKTTLVCASRDGQVYPVGSGIMPPAHWNCRSTTIPIVNDAFNIGSSLTGRRPSVGASGASTHSSRLTYGGWLRTQPVSFVDEALGIERSKLFRSGGITIDGFVDPTGRVYTLNQLEQMNPFVFQEF